MAWWVDFAPEVRTGLASFGFADPDAILEAVQHNLNLDDSSMSERWAKNPDDYFVYVHTLLMDGHLHSLVFLVNDSAKVHGVLKVVWVEYVKGEPFP